MDTFDYLHQLASIVKQMRELQKVCFKSIPDAKLDQMMTLEGRVDDLLDQLFSGPLAPLSHDLAAQLLAGDFTEEVPDLPPPPSRDEIFTDSAKQLHYLFPDLPPPPARELPDLDKLFKQWKPDEENPK